MSAIDTVVLRSKLSGLLGQSEVFRWSKENPEDNLYPVMSDCEVQHRAVDEASRRYLDAEENVDSLQPGRRVTKASEADAADAH